MSKVGVVHTNLKLEGRIQLMNWIKKMERQGWGPIAGLNDIACMAASELNLPVTKWNLRSTALGMNVTLPQGRVGVKSSKKAPQRVIVACSCGQRFSIKIKPLAYKLKGNGEEA